MTSGAEVPQDGPQGGKWLVSDAWVLAAARVSGSVEERGGLFDLVAACDAVNELIVSQGELEHALSMLVGAGLMVADEQGIGVTPQGRELVARAGRAVVGGRHGRHAREARIEALLALLRGVPATPEPFGLDGEVYEAACLEYRHTRWTEFRRPGRLR